MKKHTKKKLKNFATAYDAYKVAKERGIKCIQHDVNKGIPFKDESFDAIWAEEVIEHLYNTDYFLEEVYRVLRKGGS